MKQKPSLDALIKLLNDDDDIARTAMVQLMLHYPSELNHILLQLQECSSEILRKRSHQLQAIVKFRKRRQNLHNIIHREENFFYMSDALLDLHMMWFEKDSETEIINSYQLLLKDFHALPADSPFVLTEFLKNKQFVPLPDNTGNCDIYMMGAVFDTSFGANTFFCALLIALNEDLKLGLDFEIIRFNHRFYVLHRQSNMICDILDLWSVRPLDFSGYTVFSRNQLLKFIGSICFCNAIHDDAFRYVQILAEILNTDHDTSFLPYPYGGTNGNKTA